MHPLSLVFIATPFVCLFMAVLWLIQLRKKEADIVDFGWTISLGFLAVFYSLLADGDLLTKALVGSFGFIWAFRLGSHLWKRVIEPGEDGRYVQLRQAWGESAQQKFFIFFLAQGLLAILLSLSFLIPAVSFNQASYSRAFLATFWFLATIAGEAIADRQLHHWRADQNNKGKTCREGLWNYSRHPNYFFEWLYWFSYVILAFGAPWWELTLLAPAIILFLILKVTGIPPTEQRALKTRGEDYRLYMRSTSAFVPWFKKQF